MDDTNIPVLPTFDEGIKHPAEIQAFFEQFDDEHKDKGK